MSNINRVLNRLCKWRTVFAGWQLGTRPMDDGECRAVRDHRDATILLRAEMSAVTRLLVDKGVFTVEEYETQLATEADALNAMYEKLFPGYRATDDGIVVDVQVARETNRKLNFPP